MDYTDQRSTAGSASHYTQTTTNVCPHIIRSQRLFHADRLLKSTNRIRDHQIEAIYSLYIFIIITSLLYFTPPHGVSV